MQSNEVNWDIEPEATHFCPETEEDYPFLYKKDSSGVWMGKLFGADGEWNYKVCVDDHTLAHMISKEDKQ
jgi:hypothetical protein